MVSLALIASIWLAACGGGGGDSGGSGSAATTETTDNNSGSITVAQPVSQTPLGVPTELTMTPANNNTSLILRWVDNSSQESGFEVTRSINGNVYLPTTLPAGTTTTTLNSLTPGSTIVVKVRAINSTARSLEAAGTITLPAIAASPLTITLTANLDNYIRIQSPEANTADGIETNKYFDAGDISVGCTWMNMPSPIGLQSGFTCDIGLIKFTWDNRLTGRQIKDAQLYLTSRTSAFDVNRIFNIRAMGAPWTRTVTYTQWSNMPVTQEVQRFNPPLVGRHNYNITPFVQAWAAGSYANNGLMIFLDDASNPGGSLSWAATTFVSKDDLSVANRPQIVVIYQ
jgi:hypothetical protein